MALYPPIVASSMPAFDVKDNKVRIYYSLSTYNVAKIDDIKKVHITVRRQSSNVNVVNNAYEILQRDFGNQEDLDVILNRYFVEINSSEIDGGFSANGIYKVQLRFSTVVNSNVQKNFYTNNINNFSEWSTVCIIKAINAPEFYIEDFYTGRPPQQTDTNNFYSTLSDFVGIYKQVDSYQTLKNWRIRLLSEQYNSEEDILNIDDFTLADSGIQLNEATNYNVEDGSVIISCSLPYELQQDKNYKLLFEIQTRNGYTNSLLYNFTCQPNNINALTGTFSTYINEEEGYIKVDFRSNQIETGNLVIRRSDSKSNFLKWEDLKFFEIHSNPSFTYYDFTIESGLFYRYLVQKVDARGRRGTPLYDSSKNSLTGVMAEWQHAFLLESTGNGDLSGTKQLKLKYDFQISSYKTNISESKTDTIGSKYPFIRRNGNMYYRSFPITGVITQVMDEADLFTNSNTLFDNMYDKYKNFKGQIDEYVNRYDYTYERKFREKVEEFLYNAKPKLYKSMQQGNIFIKLMQVSLTPKNELGRLVYSFSATAYEIDQACINTYNSYNLIQIGTFNPNIYTKKTVYKQISSYDFNENIMGNLFKAGQDIIGTGQNPAANSIAKSIKYNESFNNTIVSDFTIDYLRLTIESDPYLIIEESPNSFRPYDDVVPSYTENNPNYIDKNIIRNNNIESIRDNNYQDDISPIIKYPLYQMESTYGENNVYLGWLFEIDGRQVIISPPNNVYELNWQNFSFKKQVKIIPAKDIAMLVDYRLMYVKKQDLSNLPKNIIMDKVNGQLIGTYTEDTELISQILYKYKHTYDKGSDRVKRYVNNVNTILVDTEPGTVIYLKTSAMEGGAGRFVVNHTGEFYFDPMDSSYGIQTLKIVGINVLMKDINNRGSFNDLSEVEFPKQGDACQINNEYYYYNRASWCPATLTNNEESLDVSCPVDALVFYYVSIEERIFSNE